MTYHLRHNVLVARRRPVHEQGRQVFTWRAIMNSRNNVIVAHGYDLVRQRRHTR